MNPQFPIYVVSKGRWTNQRTMKALDEINVPYRVIVEADEYEQYRKHFPDEKLLVTPPKYIEEYDHFWDDDDPRTGPLRQETSLGNILFPKDGVIIGS